MSATDELRKMLDERGVEWWQSVNTLGCVFTRWYSPLFGDEVVAMENGEEGLVVFDHYLTPEQAIAATLGAGTCRLKRASWDDGTCTWGCICTACDAHLEHETGIGYNYCPNCGRKVVDE